MASINPGILPNQGATTAVPANSGSLTSIPRSLIPSLPFRNWPFLRQSSVNTDDESVDFDAIEFANYIDGVAASLGYTKGGSGGGTSTPPNSSDPAGYPQEYPQSY